MSTLPEAVVGVVGVRAKVALPPSMMKVPLKMSHGGGSCPHVL